MAIFMTGDTHGDFSRLRPAAFYEQVSIPYQILRYPEFRTTVIISKKILSRNLLYCAENAII